MRELFAFVAELLRPSSSRRIIFIETDRPGERSYGIQGGTMRIASGLAAGTLVLATALIMAFVPVERLIPGYSAKEIRRSTAAALIRVAALEDSLSVQARYLASLRQILTGQFDSTQTAPSPPGNTVGSADAQQQWDMTLATEQRPDNGQPIFLDRFPVRPVAADAGPGSARLRAPSLPLPAAAPVSGYTTQMFNVRAGHYGVDIATEEGQVVRSIGAGHIIFADWTHSGGHTIIVQHADGFVTVYKHNQRLLKRLGDRVQQREGIAVSGNTGQHTTGPHLHFELWNNGLAQDPRPYLLNP